MAAAVRRGPLPCAKTAPMTQCAMGAVWAVVYVCCTYSCYSRSMTSVLPFRHSSCAQFSVPSRAECRQVTPCRVSSASGTKNWGNSKNFFRIEFLLLSQRAQRTIFGGSIAPKTPVLKLNRPLACKPPAAIVSESTQVACVPFAKPQVAGLRHQR